MGDGGKVPPIAEGMPSKEPLRGMELHIPSKDRKNMPGTKPMPAGGYSHISPGGDLFMTSSPDQERLCPFSTPSPIVGSLGDVAKQVNFTKGFCYVNFIKARRYTVLPTRCSSALAGVTSEETRI